MGPAVQVVMLSKDTVAKLKEKLMVRFMKTPSKWWEDGIPTVKNPNDPVIIGQIIDLMMIGKNIQANILYIPLD